MIIYSVALILVARFILGMVSCIGVFTAQLGEYF